MKRYFAIILFAAALASCTPKLYDAQVEVPENYRFAGDFPQDSVSLPFAWWEIFGDSTLNRLVEHALENNRNLAQAASRIFEARANIAVGPCAFPAVGRIESFGTGKLYRADRYDPTIYDRTVDFLGSTPFRNTPQR